MLTQTSRLLIASSFFALSACATSTRGTTEQVVFTSAPSKATVTTSVGGACTTPCSLEIPRKQDFTATFKLGNETRVIRVNTTVASEGAAAGAGNILVGGVIGIAVDASTGATLDHVPNPVHADFSKPQSAAQAYAEAYAAAKKKAKKQQTNAAK